MRRAVLAGTLALTLSAGGATAWALDRFVFEHVEISDVAAFEASQGVPSGAAGTADTANTGAETTGSGDSTVTYYVADVVLSDATVLKSAFADNSFGENITETTSAIASDHNAVP